MAEEDVIKKNYEEYKEIADYSFGKRKFNTAVTLYYKSLVELCDLELFRKIRRIGVNHTERFRMLEISAPKLYKTASKLFKFYRDSYNKEISQTIASLFKKEVEDAERFVFGKKED